MRRTLPYGKWRKRLKIKALPPFAEIHKVRVENYKRLFEIFDGISKAWSKLSDTQQARVAEILGGTRQLQVVSSILTNWKDAVGAYSDAMDSAGVATKANSIVMETTEKKLERLKAAFQELSGTALKGDFMGVLVDGGTKLIEVLNIVFKVLNALANTFPGKIVIITGALTALSTAFDRLKGLKSVKSTIDFFKDLSSA